MKLGLYTPGLQPAVRKRDAGGAWQRSDRATHDASTEMVLDDLVAVARAADDLGYEFLSCSHHVVIASDVAAAVGGSWWDPLSTFGFLAAHTRRVRFVTLVMVLGYQHPLQLVKQFSTLDRLSGGRVTVGVGVGEVPAEFALLDASFADRGARADDALRVLRVAFGHAEPVHEGPYFSVSGVVVEPVAVQAKLPLWVGGRTGRSLRRALALADGWAPFGLAATDIRKMLDTSETRRALGERVTPFEIVLTPRILDPLGDPEGARQVLARYEALGATQLALLFDHTSPGHYIDQLTALQELIARG